MELVRELCYSSGVKHPCETAGEWHSPAASETTGEGYSQGASATYPNESGATPQSPRRAELKAIFDAVDDTAILARLQAYRPTGRPVYPLRALWRAYLAAFCLNLGNTNCLIRLREDSPPLRELCGLDGPFPVRRTFNRFIRRLADHADLVADALAGVTEGLKDLLPDLGQQVAVDSTALRTHSNPNRREVSDPKASWGVKHSVKSKNKDATEWFFGYKMHAVADANYGIPLAQFVTTGRRNDSPELPALMERAKARYGWFQPAVAVADRGYDAASNHRYLHRQGIIPVIHIRRPSNKTGLYQDIYTQDGVPPCLGMAPWAQRRPSGQRLAINHSSAVASSGNIWNSSGRPMPWR